MTVFRSACSWSWPLATCVRAGNYLVDVPLRPPSLFTLKLHGTMQPAHNLSFDTHVPRYAALVMLHGVQFSAILGGTPRLALSRPLELPAIQSESALRLVIGTFDASSLPAIPRGAPWAHRTGHGYMALSIQKGSHNCIRHVRALANNSDACIGINSSP